MDHLENVLVNGRFLTQPVTGVQRFALEISRQLVQRFPALKVCTPSKSVPRANGVGLPLEKCGKFQGHLWEQYDLYRRSRRDPGTVLVNLGNSAPMRLERQIVTFHDLAFLYQPRWFSRRFYLFYRFLLPRLARRSARIITVSEFSRREIVAHLGVPAARIEVIHCAVSQVFFERARQTRRRPAEDYILAVSSADPRKNLERLILAFRQLELPGTQLLIVGRGSKVFSAPRFHALAKDIPGVRFTGYLTDALLAGLYRDARLCVFPTLYEGFGLPPLEAMACGCPTVVSKVASLPEICDDAAYYVDPRSVDDIARGMREVLRDEKLQEELRTKGWTRARAFSWERSGEALARVVKEVAEV